MNWDDLKVFLEVARSETLAAASSRLGIDSSTVSRRLHKLEQELDTQLFVRGVAGHSLTDHGTKLLSTALEIEQKTQSAIEILQGKNLQEFGDVRIGTTDAFGNYFIAGNLSKFFDQHPNINIDVLPLQRSVKLTQHEADIAITLDKPTNKSLVVAKLCDYRLQMYASKEYLAKHGEVTSVAQLSQHRLIGYVDDLIFSRQLCYLDAFLSHSKPVFRSTSVIAQASAVEQGVGLAILPCFLAINRPDLTPILCNEIDIVRQFWITAPSNKMELLRVKKIWHYLKQLSQDASPQLMGITTETN
ncbi:MAG: LysR family transcriptional regulator [Psychrobium sp.]|nr:LysR family transcriptional regulator [Psychrobium sp.]